MSEQNLQLELAEQAGLNQQQPAQESQNTAQTQQHQNDGPLSLFEPQAPSQTRVYISNLCYQATEESLAEFLKDYDPVSVLIPSQSIRGFQKSLVRPLGIAYVEFKTPEVAANAILELNGVMFMNRELKLRYHIPFKSSKEKLVRGPNKLQQIQRRLSELRKKNVAVVCARDNPDSEEEEQPALDVNHVLREASNVSLYVGHLPSKTTDGNLRDFFHEYSPQEIIVYKHRQFHGWRIRRHITAAVVTFPDQERQQSALVNLCKEQFKGRNIRMAPAFEDKLAEIRAEVQRMAVEQQLPQTAANLGIYIGNNLIAMQPLQPRNRQEHQHKQSQQDQQQSEQSQSQSHSQSQSQSQSQQLQQAIVQEHSELLPVQQDSEPARVQPLLKLQRLQMILKLQRLHKQKQKQQVENAEAPEQHEQQPAQAPEPVAAAA